MVRTIGVGSPVDQQRSAVKGRNSTVPVSAPSPDLPFSQFRRKDIDLATAQSEVTVELAGNVLWVANGTDNDALLEVKFVEGDQESDFIPMRRGMVVHYQPFSRLIVSNTAQSGKEMTLIGIDARIDTLRIES